MNSIWSYDPESEKKIEQLILEIVDEHGWIHYGSLTFNIFSAFHIQASQEEKDKFQEERVKFIVDRLIKAGHLKWYDENKRCLVEVKDMVEYHVPITTSGASPIWISPINGKLYYELVHMRKEIIMRRVRSPGDYNSINWCQSLRDYGFILMEE